MSHQEKIIISSFIALAITLGIFTLRVSDMFAAGRFDGAEGLILLGKTGLIFMGASVVVVIAVNIMFSILHAIITQNPKPSFVIDERDRYIERRGMQVSSVISGIGMIAGMIGLMQGYGAVPVFFLLVLACALGELISSLARLAMYRLGM